MKFILPMPPSINNTYAVNRTGKNTFYKKKNVKDWEKEAGWMIKKQWKGSKNPFNGDVQVGIDFYYADNRDIDNGLKVLFDLLQKQRVVINDKQIRKITHVNIYQDLQNPRVEIEIEALRR
jgi:Holliday junction resolvase RusA-like endonuclease